MRNKTIGIGLSILLSSIPLIAVGAESPDLKWRLEHLDGEAYRLSIRHAMKKSGKTEKGLPEWESSLRELISRKADFLQQLAKNDPKIVKKVEELFQTLDHAMLSTPEIANKQILVLSRKLGERARFAMGNEAGLAPSNFQNNSEIQQPTTKWDNEFVVLRGIDKNPKKEVVFKPKPGVILNDPELHFDGTRLLYSSIGTNNRWHLFELDLKSGNATQVTPEAYKDFDSFDGCYTPDDKIIFCSTGTFLGLPCTDGGNKMCGLFKYDPQTNKTRQLTFDQDSNWEPVVLENGKIMYQRWEYADLPHSNSRIIFTMNPDGTEQKAYYGSNSYFPTALFGGRPVPGKSSQFVGVVGGHHSTTRSGRFMLFDTNVGRKEADGVLGEFPYFGKKVTPVVRDRLPDGIFPQFLHPYPISEDYYLVTMKPTPESLWGVYLADKFNNLTLITEEEGVALFNPILLEKRTTPPVIPDKTVPGAQEATVFIQDIYAGGGLKGIPKGTVKKLRIGSYSFSPHGQGGLLGTIGMDGPWDIKQIEGTVDVEEDGSVMFKIPANTPIFVQPVDEEGKALQVMRSWFTGMPGETVSCIGCHEDQRTIPQPKPAIASRKKPQPIQPWFGQERGFSFAHEVQPVLDRYCISCHNGQKDRPYLKGDRMISDWTSQISGRAGTSYGGKFSKSYEQLARYVRRPGIESDMDMLTPMDVHADQTELMQILNKGHYGVNLDQEAIEKLSCWIDFNTPYFGRRRDVPEAETREVVKCGQEMRKLYAEMFQVKDRDLSWLPEKQNIEPIKPEVPSKQVTPVQLEGWPLKNNFQHQINLGNFQKEIELADGIVLKMIKVPAGKFIMGSDRQPDELPLSPVQIERPFWIGQFEVTNEQYALFNAEHNSRTEHRHGYQFGRIGYPLNHNDQPVVRISYEEAVDFCNWLSKKTGKTFTLPTEAEWEWACRTGKESAYSFGDIGGDFTSHANLGDIKLKEFAACTSHKFYESARIIDNANIYDDWIPRDTIFNDGGFVSERVGKYRQNDWDLFDMHGNVWEWTRSAYKPYPYQDNDGRNETNTSDKRVVRGGSWYDRPHKATSTYRLPYLPFQKVYNVGFRVVMHE